MNQNGLIIYVQQRGADWWVWQQGHVGAPVNPVGEQWSQHYSTRPKALLAAHDRNAGFAQYGVSELEALCSEPSTELVECEPQRWEYKVEESSGAVGSLDRRGEEGWELIHFQRWLSPNSNTHRWEAIFKRPKGE